jgi:GNAT superfamily N-acetyltransferase
MRQLAFQIRRANAGDGAAIVSCLESAFAQYRDRYTPAAFADTVLDGESVQLRLRKMALFVAVSGDDVVGTIGCVANDDARGHLRGMAVLPAWQGQGVAFALLDAAEGEMRRFGCTRMTLNTTEPLTRAIRFYEKHGYAATGRVRDFFGMNLYEYSKPLH